MKNIMGLKYLLVALTVLFGVSITSTSFAATLTVTKTTDAYDAECTPEDCSLREAINKAQAMPGDDEIILPSGTYDVTMANVDGQEWKTGSLDISSQNVTIKKKDGDVDPVIISANNSDRVFFIYDSNVTFKDMTIKGGNASNLSKSPYNEGGGIYNDKGIVEFINCTIEGNTAQNGGGIYNSYTGTVTLSESIVTGNISNIDNKVGSAVFNSNGSLTVINSTIDKNAGRGINNVKGQLKVISSTISNNSVLDVGGGINNNSGNATIINSTISSNWSKTGGGGIHNASGDLYVSDSTITMNKTDKWTGGGLDTGTGKTTMINTILAGNSAGGSSPDFMGNEIVSKGYNIIGNNGGWIFTAIEGDKIGTTASPIDPKLGILADNGGPTKTHALLAGSPAIDGGNLNGCVDVDGNSVIIDQRSMARSGPCDIGSFDISSEKSSCGDSVVQAEKGEECDDGNEINTDACVTGCKKAKCGDGFGLIGVEECDDGNNVNTDSCINTCKKTTTNDGFVWKGFEQCDDGNDVKTDACNNGSLAKCGDGVIWSGVEECDDGNTSDVDECTNTCKDAKCGDGIVWAGVEACDDGNTDDTDTCPSTCKSATCGDNAVQAGVEACDDGNNDNTDICLTSCVSASCGDGFVQAGAEVCDDGNSVDTDACLSTCKLAKCGDGYVEAGIEECDGGDNCTAECKNKEAAIVTPTTTTAYCGNGTVETGEDCDGGDNCTAECKNKEATTSTTSGGDTGGGTGSSSSTEESGGGGGGGGGCSLIR